MSSRISTHIRNNLVGCIALFCALSGAAYAVTKAPPNSVVSRSIKNGQVKKPDLRNGAVTTQKFAASAVVPKAAHAANADELFGSPPSSYQQRVTDTCDRALVFINSAGQMGCDSGPVEGIRLTPGAGEVGERFVADSNLFLDVLCHYNGKTELAFTNNSGGGATLNWLYSNGTTAFASGNSLSANGTATDTQEFSFAGARIEGQFIFAYGPNVTTFVLHAFDGTSFCEERGNSYVGES
jgi:hypothetical protein